jgi:hypothetical protein
MSERDPLDQRLSAIFGVLDARPGFNARLLDRLQREVTEEAERAERARQVEQLRHGVAKQELRSWRRRAQALGQFVTLETAGIGVLAGAVLTSAWSSEQIRQLAPALITVVGVLLALAPAILQRK